MLMYYSALSFWGKAPQLHVADRSVERRFAGGYERTLWTLPLTRGFT